MENNQSKNNNSKFFIIAIIVVALLVIGVFLFSILPYPKDSECNDCNENSTNSYPSDYDGSGFSIPSARGNVPSGLAKPIIYLYPETTIQLSVNLGRPENITCSYPDYKNGWNVIANPDGTLIDTNTGRQLYSLYWEGIQNELENFEDGFVVSGEDSIQFLEEKLTILGLTEREAEEFIVYWLPKLQENKYNYIRFATPGEINEIMPLEFSTEPDTIIRVLMQFKPLDDYIEVPEQKLETPERTGFVVVEWGGTEIK